MNVIAQETTRGLSRVILVLSCGATLATLALAQPQYPPLPGMLTASGAFGAQFSRGYDPVLGNLKAPVIDFHYTVS